MIEIQKQKLVDLDGVESIFFEVLNPEVLGVESPDYGFYIGYTGKYVDYNLFEDPYNWCFEKQLGSYVFETVEVFLNYFPLLKEMVR